MKRFFIPLLFLCVSLSAQSLHTDSKTTNVHTPFRWFWDDQATRLSQSITQRDTLKMGWVRVDSTAWVLVDSPAVWIRVGSTGDSITTNYLNIDTANIDTADVGIIDADSILVGYLNADTINVDTIDANTVISTLAGISTLQATNINSFNLNGKLTAGVNEIEGSSFDINGGSIDADLSWTASQNFNDINLTNINKTDTDTLIVTDMSGFNLRDKLTADASEIEGSNFDINGGSIDGTVIGGSSATEGNFTDIIANNVFTGSVNTGQGYNELYDMNQDVQTNDAVTFRKVTTDSIISSDTLLLKSTDPNPYIVMTGLLNLAPSSVEISSNQLDRAGAGTFIEVSPEGAATLDTITSVSDWEKGDYIILKLPFGSSDSVLIVHGAGFVCQNQTDFLLDQEWDNITFLFDGLSFIEISRSDNIYP